MDGPVAVRSSAVGEDSADSTFAGMGETFLFVAPEDVPARVRDCWAETDRARAYREQLGLGQARMSVAVQAMVDADVSGVLFTCNPVSGDPSTVAINASWGLGLAVVGGEVTPDEYLLSKVTGEVVKTDDRRQAPRVPARATARPGRAPLDRRASTTRSSRSCSTLAKRIEAHFGSHQDVEFAFAGGELYVLQARPVTVKPEAKPVADAMSLLMGRFGALS